MRKPVIIGTVIFFVFATGGLIAKDKISQSANLQALKEDPKNKTQILPSPTPMPSQVVSIMPNKKQEPFYSVEIKSSTYNFNSFVYTAILRNIHTTPFITNFGFFDCNFSDESGNIYSGIIPDKNTFEKAIFPKESREFTSNQSEYLDTPSGLERTGEGFQKCSYNEKGENECKPINILRITDCVGYISTDGKAGGYGGNGGQFPIKVTFPTF